MDIERKKLLGEVFTPNILVNEILDRLPERVWKDRTLKWLEPSNGIGNFTIEIIERLKKNIEEKHIMENMITVCEIDNKNIESYKKRISGQYKCNINRVNYLQWKSEIKFDIIIGNPPFNTPKGKNKDMRSNNGILWDKFIIKSIKEHLKESGLLCFITPCNWRKPKSKNNLYELMCKENQMRYLKMYDYKQGMELFNVGTRFDYYIIEKTKCKENTEIIDIKRKKDSIDLRKYEFLPNYNIIKIKYYLKNNGKIINSTRYHASTYKDDLEDKSVVKTINEINKVVNNVVIHSITKNKGIIYYRAKTIKDGFFGIGKVIVCLTKNIVNPINDYQGLYAFTQYCVGIRINDKEEGERIINLLESKEFREVIDGCRWSNSSDMLDAELFKRIDF